MKLRSLRLWPAVLTGGAFGLAALGCVVESDHDGGGAGYVSPSGSGAQQAQVAGIDTGATLKSTPGTGVGIYVEYAAGGAWHVWTTCDVNEPTNPTQQPCVIDVDVISTTSLAATSDGLGTSGYLDPQPGDLHLHAETTTGTDGMRFTTTAGEPVQVQVALEGATTPEDFVFWIGLQSDGTTPILHTGAPTNPIELQPSTP